MQEREGGKSQNIGKVSHMIERERNKIQNSVKQNLDYRSKFLSKHHKLLNSVSSNRNSLMITPPPPSSSSTSPIPLQGTLHKTVSSGPSLGIQLPLKRSSRASVEHDDDFQ